MRRRRRSQRLPTAACLLLLAATASGCARLPRDPPELAGRHVAGFAGGPIELRGLRFGGGGPGHEVVVASGGSSWRVASASADVLGWEDERIELRLPDAPLAHDTTLRVRTPWGASAPARLERFAHDHFEIRPEAERVSPPLAVAVDARHRVWIHQEFHTALHVLDPASGRIERLDIPVATDPGPFATRLYGGARTFVSELGEDILVDPAGRVWLTQGGGFLYGGPHPNHSRILSYRPAGPGEPDGGFRTWTVPGDRNEVKGIEWDPVRRRIWFSEGSASWPARLTSFDPERVTPDGDGGESVAGAAASHAGGAPVPGPRACAPDGDCFRSWLLPDPGAQPAHLRIDRDGYVWTTGSWSNALYRLDPETGEFLTYPLPASRSQVPEAETVGSCPWQLRIGPDGNLYFSEFFDASVGRFDAARAEDPACTRLDESGRNPCIDEHAVVPASARLRVHSIAFDADGRLWFTEHEDRDGQQASLGFVTADWREVVRLPSLARFPADAAPSNDGIAIDPVTGDIWFAEFWRGRIGRLRAAGGGG